MDYLVDRCKCKGRDSDHLEITHHPTLVEWQVSIHLQIRLQSFICFCLDMSDIDSYRYGYVISVGVSYSSKSGASKNKGRREKWGGKEGNGDGGEDVVTFWPYFVA